MPFSTTYANNILDYLFSKKDMPSAPSNVYIGLCTNDPEADKGTVNELSGGGYARVLVGLKNEAFPNVIGSASARKIQNDYQINWTKATADWERVNGFFLSSSATVGETSGIFFYGKLDLSDEDIAAGGLLVETGSVALFDPQSFHISFPYADLEET